jgi:putative ABC transport system permease protein
MNVATIELSRLALAFLPVLVVVAILWSWQLNARKALVAVGRMLVQLLLIGYVLVYIFEADSGGIVLGVILIMVVVSAWIALNTVVDVRRELYPAALISVTVGGGLTLALITQLVLEPVTWYEPRFLIPLAGMTFSNAMTSLSLAAERLQSELANGRSFLEARNTAYQTGMIPVINALLAVGLVSLPGMMTGQILAGVSPFIAARYQILVMCMIFASAGLSTALYLVLARRVVLSDR